MSNSETKQPSSCFLLDFRVKGLVKLGGSLNKATTETISTPTTWPLCQNVKSSDKFMRTVRFPAQNIEKKKLIEKPAKTKTNFFKLWFMVLAAQLLCLWHVFVCVCVSEQVYISFMYHWPVFPVWKISWWYYHKFTKLVSLFSPFSTVVWCA